MSAALVRQWMILSHLPRAPHRIDAAGLSVRLRERGIVVHQRTIQRDLVELASVLPIIADERSKPYGWRWADDARLFAPEPAKSSVPVVLRVEAEHQTELATALGLRAKSPGVLAGSTPNNVRLQRIVLAYEAEVVAPRSLRDAVRERALSIARRNGSA